MAKIEEFMNNNKDSEQPEGKQIDMSIIERIKRMRSQSREPAETLSRKRDETISELSKKSVIEPECTLVGITA